MIPLYYFQSTKNVFRVAWAIDSEGTNLPDTEYWNLKYPMPIPSRTSDPFLRSVIDGLQRDGYFVYDLKKKH
jgi:hypothetical protein